MTIITGASDGSSNILTTEQFSAIENANVVSHSSTKLVLSIPVPGGAVILTFTGSGLVIDSHGDITAGTATGLTIKDPSTTSVSTWSGFSVSAVTLSNYFASGNVSAFNTLMFGGNDTFTSHAPADGFGGNQDNNNFEGFAGNDTFNLQHSEGDDFLRGDSGNDVFNFGADFSHRENLDGGTGTDVVNLAGNYAGGVTFGALTMVNVEKIELGAGFDYKLTTNNATVASGATLTVNASKLAAANTLNFNGNAETNGKFIIDGGAGKDTLTGGAGSDTINGGAGNDILRGGKGADHLNGGTGADHFVYVAAAESTGTNYDTVTAFDALADKFDVPGTISGINTAIASGALSTASFNADLAAAVTASHLAAHHAVEFTPNAGTLKGDHFLIVDVNGVVGYQANADLVVLLSSPANITHLGTGDFI